MSAMAAVTNPYWPALPIAVPLFAFFTFRRLIRDLIHRSWLSPGGFIRRCIFADTFVAEAAMAACLIALGIAAWMKVPFPAFRHASWSVALIATGFFQTVALASQSMEARIWTCLASFICYLSLILASLTTPPLLLFIVLGAVELLCFVHLVRYGGRT